MCNIFQRCMLCCDNREWVPSGCYHSRQTGQWMEAAVMGPGVWRLCQWRVPWTSPRLVMRSVSCCPAPATPAPTIRYESTMTIFILCGVRIINIYNCINYYNAFIGVPSLSDPLLLFHDHISSFGALCCGAAISLAVPAGHWPNITNESGEKFWHFTNTCWLGKVGPPELRLLCAQVETWS